MNYINSKVAGISFCEKNINKLELDKELTCKLVKEPQNPYDPNAIMVKAKNDKTGRYLKIGYLPKGNPKKLKTSNSLQTTVTISKITGEGEQFYSAKVYQEDPNINNRVVAQSELMTLRYTEYQKDLTYLGKQLNKMLSTPIQTPTTPIIKSTQIDYEQGTMEWLQARENKITGTTAYSYFAKNKLIKNSTNNFQNIYTEHGHIFERVIHRQIEEILDTTNDYSYISSPNSYIRDNLLASPDGLLTAIKNNNSIVVEIKNFQPSGFRELQDLESERFKKVYYQVQLNMFLTNSSYGLLIAYCPQDNTKPSEHYFIHKITPNKEIYEQFSNECNNNGNN